MNRILQKINNHEYLNNNDIARFIDIKSIRKTTPIFLENQSDIMGYSYINSQIIIDKAILEKIKKVLEKCSVTKNNEESYFWVDLYNIYLVNMMFHELEHAKQYENIKNKFTPKNRIIKESIKFGHINPKLYKEEHDLYYFEYDATIKALVKTLNFIKVNCNNLNKESITEFNRIISTIIYHSYGNEYKGVKKSKTYSQFDSPICYTKYLSNIYHNSKQKLILTINIEKLKNYSDYEYLKLINGLNLSNKTLHLLYYISERKIITTNVLNEVKKIDKKKIKIK